MVSLVSLIIIISVSMLVTKIASISLTHTGLSRQAANFQARSALTGVGFTTGEAEKVTNHPVRRKIIMSLMLVGNAGIITALASLMLTFVDVNEQGVNQWVKLAILFVSMVFLLLIARSKTIDRLLSQMINKLLKKYTDLNVRDYAQLLRLTGEYSIFELRVEKDDWLVDKSLGDLNLRHEGINVLSVTRSDNTYLGVPTGDTVIEEDDILILYGKTENLKNLDERRKGRPGDTEHEQKVKEFESEKRKEKVKDEKKKPKREH